MKKLIAIFALLSVKVSLFAAAEFVTIGTGSVTGTYYPTGGAICRLVNKYKKETRIRCSVESTGGSVYNINAISMGDLDFGIAQSDAVYHAINGKKSFKKNPMKKLRSVMSIYPELLSLVVKTDSNINSIYDIKDKRINIGNLGSGNETTVSYLLNHLNIKKSDLGYVGKLKVGEAPDALREDKIDGYFYMVGHPTANIKDASSSSNIKLVPISGKEIDKFIEKNPFYVKGEIPAAIYSGVPSATPTFGSKAVLITSSDVSNKAVYTLVKAILENFEKFKNLHPVYKYITKESLLEGLSAPLHDGAVKYYKENNFIK
ncbi:TAXI family TRAP transporter solute-binding subunit [Halarcobacter sp.]|uniref:TAXI family TRAP transporter solute-binding subunit n=1 Tax=Halarcobacter TaxID=2321115 RepID=UPI003AFF7ADB